METLLVFLKNIKTTKKKGRYLIFYDYLTTTFRGGLTFFISYLTTINIQELPLSSEESKTTKKKEDTPSFFWEGLTNFNIISTTIQMYDPVGLWQNINLQRKKDIPIFLYSSNNYL